MSLQDGPYYSSSLGQSGNQGLTDNGHDHYPDLDPSMVSNTHMYSLAGGALQAHQNPTDRDFAGLIQAATAAAGQEAGYAQGNGGFGIPRRTTRQTMANTAGLSLPTHLAQEFPERGTVNISARKRKRQSHHTGLEQATLPTQVGGLSANGLDTEQGHDQDQDQDLLQDVGPNARFAGIQSGTALFRSPSASSKKYTRPPISKMFKSLELSPENFLHLQAAAKAYMLDPDHPERRDCVGQRGKGDSELVKMRLWNCVAEFLDEEGYGESHFGESIPGSEGTRRGMMWPKDRNRIIGAVLPLLRRMVTNERQRQYAVESRKGGNTSNGKRHSSASRSPSPTQMSSERGVESRSTIGAPHIDDPSFPAGGEDISAQPKRSIGGTTFCDGSLRLRLSILQNQRRIRPSYQILAEECPDVQTIYTKFVRVDGNIASDKAVLSVLLPQGLTNITCDDQWVRALSTVQETEWMDGEAKVVVEFP